MSVHQCFVKNNISHPDLPTVDHGTNHPVLRNCEICERLSGFSTDEFVHLSSFHVSHTPTDIEASFVPRKNCNLPDVVLSCTPMVTSSKMMPGDNTPSLFTSSNKMMPERIGRFLKEAADDFERNRNPVKNKKCCAKLSWEFDGENILKHLVSLISFPIEFCHRKQMR